VYKLTKKKEKKREQYIFLSHPPTTLPTMGISKLKGWFVWKEEAGPSPWRQQG